MTVMLASECKTYKDSYSVDNDFAFGIGFIMKKQSLIPRVIYGEL